jgi:hypothetical protein
VQSNSQKDLWMAGGATFSRNDDKITQNNNYNFQIRWLLSNQFSLSSASSFSAGIDNNQYVMQKWVNDKKEYVVGKINRKTIYTTLRAEYFVTPELSLQYYGSPYATTGRYTDFRKVADAKAVDLQQRFTPLQIIDNGTLLIDENQNLVQDLNDYTPNFNFQEFRSNFVARWEYKTGSTIYFVWTNNRSRYEDAYNSSILNSLKGISKVEAQNAFMIKLSYWFSL